MVLALLRIGLERMTVRRFAPAPHWAAAQLRDHPQDVREQALRYGSSSGGEFYPSALTKPDAKLSVFGMLSYETERSIISLRIPL